MGYGRRSTSGSAYESNNPRCINCDSRHYWRNDCFNCASYPIRTCRSCGKSMQTEKADCLYCEQPLGPLVFGVDRLPREAAICKAWPKDANPFASKAVKGAAKAWKEARSRITGLRSCFVCGNQFQLSTKASQTFGARRNDLRDRVIPAKDYVNGEWVDNPRRYGYDTSQKAHRDCPMLPDEVAAIAASKQLTLVA